MLAEAGRRGEHDYWDLVRNDGNIDQVITILQVIPTSPTLHYPPTRASFSSYPGWNINILPEYRDPEFNLR